MTKRIIALLGILAIVSVSYAAALDQQADGSDSNSLVSIVIEDICV